EPEKTEPEKTETEEPAKAEVETPSTESIGLQAALVAERHKRQAVEEKLKSLEEPEKIPDPIEDPEGYANHIKKASSKGLLETRIALSRDLMIDSKDDYLEKEKVFMGLIGTMDDGKLTVTNELLFKQFQESKNPGRFAYNFAVDHLLAEKYKDPKFEENLKAQLKDEILAELKAPKEGISATELPDLTKATATASNTEPVVKSKDTIGDVFVED
ncbi:MAG: hypothetical protein O7D95_02840, partial [Betaproteobacteria bacterium]|nr:hypothetical protein [Betaproteobacteria bacterium]